MLAKIAALPQSEKNEGMWLAEIEKTLRRRLSEDSINAVLEGAHPLSSSRPEPTQLDRIEAMASALHAPVSQLILYAERLNNNPCNPLPFNPLAADESGFGVENVDAAILASIIWEWADLKAAKPSRNE